MRLAADALEQHRSAHASADEGPFEEPLSPALSHLLPSLLYTGDPFFQACRVKSDTEQYTVILNPATVKIRVVLGEVLRICCMSSVSAEACLLHALVNFRHFVEPSRAGVLIEVLYCHMCCPVFLQFQVL